MKIIAKDNFDRDTVSDVLVCENICEWYGKKVVEFLNSIGGLNADRFYVLVQDDHKLYKWEP